MRSDQKLAIKCAWIDLRACNLQLAQDYIPEAQELTKATRQTIEELETKFPWLLDDERHELEQIALKQEWDEEQETKEGGDDD